MSRRATLLAVLGLCVVSAAALPGTLFGRELFERDVDLVWAAQAAAVGRALVDGAWPLWDPRATFGQPLLANPNVQVLYPPAWLGVLLAPGIAYTLYVHLHLVWAGLGVRALALRLGRGPWAASFAGALFVVAGPTLSVVNVWHHLAGLAWLPWVLLLADRALVRGDRRSVITWGAAAAVQLFAGSPDLCLATHYCSAALAAVRLFDARAAWRGRLTALVLAALVGVGLGAAQWLPTLDLVARSPRASLAPEARLYWSLQPQALIQVALPIGFGEIPKTASASTVAALAELWNPFLASVHLGAVALALAAAGALAAGRAGGLLSGLAALSLLLALGRHTPLHELVVALPGLSSQRYPSKFITLLSLAVALLAAAGVERLGAGHVRAFRGGLALVAMGTLALAAGLPFAPDVAGAPTWRELMAAQSASLAFAASLVLLAFVASAKPAARAGVAAAAALLAPLAFNGSANATAPPGFVAARPRNVEAVRALGTRAYVWDYGLPGRLAVPGLPGAFLDVPYEPQSQARVLALREYLMPPSAGRWGIAGSYERDLMGFFDPPQRAAVAALRAAEGTDAYPRLLQRGGVEVVLALHSHDHVGLEPRGELPGLFRRPILVYAVPDSLPRAFAVGGVRAVATDVAAVEELADAGFDPRAEVALAGTPPRRAPAGFVAKVAVTARRADALELEAELSHPGHVVLLEAWAPGWQAEVDGVAAPVWRANGIFRAVAVDAGRHRVTLRYRPLAASLGLALSLATACAVALAWRKSRS